MNFREKEIVTESDSLPTESAHECKMAFTAGQHFVAGTRIIVGMHEETS